MEYRPYYLGQEWLKMGHKVDIIAGTYSHLRYINPPTRGSWYTEDRNGIRYWWVRTNRYHGNGIRRALNIFEFSLRLLYLGRVIAATVKPEIIIASSTHPLDSFGARRIRRLTSFT